MDHVKTAQELSKRQGGVRSDTVCDVMMIIERMEFHAAAGLTVAVGFLVEIDKAFAIRDKTVRDFVRKRLADYAGETINFSPLNRFDEM